MGGLLAGITPVWASEIEPYAVRVTTKRLPFVKHYGDISKMDGGNIEPVDIITFGSPCQDMSVAGKRDGLDGSRSSLFYEAIRIIKEMREKTNGKYPRYAVWENVPGAFSSNKGEDFRCVLESFCKICDEAVSVPAADKWLPAGEILGNGYSVAWRVFDAQYWGTPQRRKRIYLVADFTGWRAGKILFESEGLSGYSAEGFRAWQRTAENPEKGSGTAGGENEGLNSVFAMDGYNGSMSEQAASIGTNCGMSTGRNGLVLCDQGGERMDVLEDKTATLRAEARHPFVVMEAAGFCTEHSAKSRSIGYEEETSPTLRAGVVPAAVAIENYPTDSRIKIDENGNVQTLTRRAGSGGNNVPLVMEQKVYGVCSKNSNSMKSDNPNSGFYEAETTRTLDANGGRPDCAQGGMVVVCVDQGGGKSSVNVSEELAPTLATSHGGEPVVAFAQNQREEVRDLDGKAGALVAEPGIHQQTFVLQGSMIGRADKNGPQGSGINEDVCFTLDGADRHAVAYGIGRDAFNQGKNALYKPAIEEEKQPTLVAKGPGAVAEPTYSASKASFFTMVSEEVANTLVATDYKDPPIVNDSLSYGFYPQMKAEGINFTEEKCGCLVNGTNPGFQNGVLEADYIVRRLTPTECARLQGFPDWWCANLETNHPTIGDLDFWTKVFETHRELVTHASKPKTEKQIIKWLKNPSADSAEYRLWGNGIYLGNAYFVLSGIVWADGLEVGNEDSDY